jgi:hypothetical protein
MTFIDPAGHEVPTKPSKFDRRYPVHDVQGARRAADPRMVFLHRAHSRLLLVENGLMTVDEAVFGLLADYCPCMRRPA